MSALQKMKDSVAGKSVDEIKNLGRIPTGMYNVTVESVSKDLESERPYTDKESGEDKVIVNWETPVNFRVVDPEYGVDEDAWDSFSELNGDTPLVTVKINRDPSRANALEQLATVLGVGDKEFREGIEASIGEKLVLTIRDSGKVDYRNDPVMYYYFAKPRD